MMDFLRHLLTGTHFHIGNGKNYLHFVWSDLHFLNDFVLSIYWNYRELMIILFLEYPKIARAVICHAVNKVDQSGLRILTVETDFFDTKKEI